MSRILYLQHLNPAAYPPLERSSRILAERGWTVRFLGVHSMGVESLALPPHPNIDVEIMPYIPPGWRQKLAYLSFFLRAIQIACTWRPDWLYVSDSLAAPCGYLISKLFDIRIVYHEHDSPQQGPSQSSIIRLVLRARAALARRSDLNVVPQQGRLDQFVIETKTARPTLCVWNCPLRAEAMPESRHLRQPDQPLGVYFHGSINLDRLPLALIAGATLSGVPIRLRIVGYETIGSQGASAQLAAAAAKAGPLVTLELPGPVSRHLLSQQTKDMHVGWINTLNPNDDIGLRHFVGASVKAFDYLAAGLPLIIPSQDDWIGFYETPGYARSCNAADMQSIAACLRWFYQNPAGSTQMGQNGKQRILDQWNYESQFEAVLTALESHQPG